MNAKIDQICDKIDGFKEELSMLLKEIRAALNSNSIVFAHNRKYRYQIEVPAEFVPLFEANPPSELL